MLLAAIESFLKPTEIVDYDYPENSVNVLHSLSAQI